MVAVNKMDDHSVGYSQARYEQIKTDLGAYLKKVPLFGVRGSGFRAEGSGSRAEGSGFRV